MGAHEGRVAVVTGAGSGIGRATVDRLLAEGASVVAVDLEGTELPDGAAPVHGDVTDPELNAEAVATAVDRFGGLDAAVLNAGIGGSGDLIEMPMEEYDRVMEVNVRAVVLGIRACVPAMRERGGGAIAVTASTSGLGADPGMWAYNASKAAVINLARAAAIDLGPEGIRVNAVAPGPTETGMTTRIQAAPEMYEALRRRSALLRWGRAEEVAAVLAFLVSPDAGIVTGAVVPADGGISANAGQFPPIDRRHQ